MLLLCAVCSLMSTFYVCSMEETIKVILKVDTNNKIKVTLFPFKSFTREQKEGLQPSIIEKFHDLLESGNIAKAQQLLEKNIWLATIPRAFTKEVPLVTLLTKLLKQKLDDNELKQCLAKIIGYNLLINKNYKLNSDSAEELKNHVDTLFEKNSDQSKLLYDVIEEQSVMLDKIFDNENKEDEQSIQGAFGASKQRKLLNFFKIYAEWAKKNYANNNTPLLLAIKNFSGFEEDRFLIEYLLTHDSSDLFKKGKDEDPFDAIRSFSKDPLTKNNYEEQLFNIIRGFFSSVLLNESLIQEFSEKIEQGKYSKALSLIKRNPALYYATFKDNKDIKFYINKLEGLQLDEELKLDFESIQKWTPIFKKQKQGFFQTLKNFRKTSETNIKKVDDTVRRFSIAVFSLSSKQTKANVTTKLNKNNISYQKQYFASSFSFGEKNKN